jgi:hypothetical protein
VGRPDILLLSAHSKQAFQSPYRDVWLGSSLRENCAALVKIPAKVLTSSREGSPAWLAGGLIVMPHPNTVANRASIIILAARYRLPAIYPYRYFATEGGLLS